MTDSVLDAGAARRLRPQVRPGVKLRY